MFLRKGTKAMSIAKNLMKLGATASSIGRKRIAGAIAIVRRRRRNRRCGRPNAVLSTPRRHAAG